MTGPAFDYVAGGAWDEITLAESVEAWRRYRFVPRVLRDVRTIDVCGSVPRPPVGAARSPIAPMAAQAPGPSRRGGGDARRRRGGRDPVLPVDHIVAAARGRRRRRPDAERWFQLYVIGGMGYSRQPGRTGGGGRLSRARRDRRPAGARPARAGRAVGLRAADRCRTSTAPSDERDRRYGAIEDQWIDGPDLGIARRDRDVELDAARRQGHPLARTMRGWPRRPASPGSSSPPTAGASSTARSARPTRSRDRRSGRRSLRGLGRRRNPPRPGCPDRARARGDGRARRAAVLLGARRRRPGRRRPGHRDPPAPSWRSLCRSSAARPFRRSIAASWPSAGPTPEVRSEDGTEPWQRRLERDRARDPGSLDR